MTPPLCGPLYHHHMEKKIYSYPENQTKTQIMSSTIENSHYVYWHRESQLIRHKSTYDKKYLKLFGN